MLNVSIDAATVQHLDERFRHVVVVGASGAEVLPLGARPQPPPHALPVAGRRAAGAHRHEP